MWYTFLKRTPKKPLLIEEIDKIHKSLARLTEKKREKTRGIAKIRNGSGDISTNLIEIKRSMNNYMPTNQIT